MKIDLNIDELIEEFNLPKNTADFMVESSVDLVTQEIYRQWALSASKKLHSTRNLYLNGLNIIRNSQFSQTIMLSGVMPNLIENGASPFDMKIGFAKSNKIVHTQKKDNKGNVISTGWYLTIPFRQGTTGIVGENAAFANIMPQQVYDIARKEGIVRKSAIPSPYDIPKTRKQINLPNRVIPAYTHKSSIYEGIVKKSSAYQKVIQNTYVSFRRVSSSSDTNSWWNKGWPAYNLLKDALGNTDIQTIVDNNIDATLKSLGYGG
jgi:hypothetical protein